MAVTDMRTKTVWGKVSVAGGVAELSKSTGITLSRMSQRSPMIHQSIREVRDVEERNLKKPQLISSASQTKSRSREGLYPRIRGLAGVGCPTAFTIVP